MSENPFHTLLPCHSAVQARLAQRETIYPQDMRVIHDVLTPRPVFHLDPPEKSIPANLFKHYVRQLLDEMGYENYGFGNDALDVLHQAVEDYLVEVFEKAYAVTLSV